jgi:hypothetical protein
MRKLFVCVCLVQLLVVGMLRAQANRATITGTVTDSSGGAVVGVEVTAKSGASVSSTFPGAADHESFYCALSLVSHDFHAASGDAPNGEVALTHGSKR